MTPNALTPVPGLAQLLRDYSAREDGIWRDPRFGTVADPRLHMLAPAGYLNTQSYADGGAQVTTLTHVLNGAGTVKIRVIKPTGTTVLAEVFDDTLASKLVALNTLAAKVMALPREGSFPGALDVATRVVGAAANQLTVEMHIVLAYKGTYDVVFSHPSGQLASRRLFRPYVFTVIGDDDSETLLVDFPVEAYASLEDHAVTVGNGIPPSGWETGGKMNGIHTSRAEMVVAARTITALPEGNVVFQSDLGVVAQLPLTPAKVQTLYEGGSLPNDGLTVGGAQMWLSLFIALVTYLLSPKGTDAEKRKALLAAAAAGGVAYVATNYTDWGRDISGSFDEALGLGGSGTKPGDDKDGIKIPKPAPGSGSGLGNIGGWLPAVIGGGGAAIAASSAPSWVLWAGLGLAAYLVLK